MTAQQSFVRHMPYAPASDIKTKVLRRLTPLRNRRMIRYRLDRPIVSFTFDDCPKSAITHGINPMEREGWRGTVYVACKLFGITNHHGEHITGDDVKALHDSGHEIGDHSFSHIDALQTPLEDFIADIDVNQAALNTLGLPDSRTFAYPFGQVSARLKSSLEARFDGLRGIQPGPMTDRADLNQIRSTPVFRGANFDSAIAQINALASTPAWLTLFMHDISDSPSPWGCTPAQMQAVIEAVKASGTDVLPVCEAIDVLKGPLQ